MIAAESGSPGSSRRSGSRPAARRVRDAARHRRQARRHARPARPCWSWRWRTPRRSAGPRRARSGSSTRSGGSSSSASCAAGRQARSAACGCRSERGSSAASPAPARPRWSTTWPPIRAGRGTPGEFQTRAILAVPLRAHGSVIGVLQLLNPVGRDRFTEGDLRRMRQFAGHPGADRCRTPGSTPRSSGSSCRWSPPWPRRSRSAIPTPAATSAGWSAYSLLLGAELGLCAVRSCEDLRLAATLHDIGKIHVRDRILGKPAPLDAEEDEIMQPPRRSTAPRSSRHLANPWVVRGRAQPPRADRRQGVSRRPGRRRDPARRPHHRRGRHLRRDDHQPPLPRRPAAGARRRRDPRPAAGSQFCPQRGGRLPQPVRARPVPARGGRGEGVAARTNTDEPD